MSSTTKTGRAHVGNGAATFVTTWMPSDAGRLMADTAGKYIIDKDETRRRRSSSGAA